MLAQVRYQVAFGSLEPILGVGGELAADVGGGPPGDVARGRGSPA
jgi:hypothetical protein